MYTLYHLNFFIRILALEFVTDKIMIPKIVPRVRHVLIYNHQHNQIKDYDKINIST